MSARLLLTERVAAILRRRVERERERERLLEIVLDGFEPDTTSRSKRSDVYSYVAKRLGRPINNELCIAVREALTSVPGVVEIVSNGRARFLGLRSRVAEVTKDD